MRVCMIGDSNVGKSSIVTQFVASEYMKKVDTSLAEEYGEKSICVNVDGEEVELAFIDHPSYEMSVENTLSTYEPHACIVVYSISDRESFRKALDILHYLMTEMKGKRSVILVGNKNDQEDIRRVSILEGIEQATVFGVKFIETSSILNKNMDELLVGVTKQIMLRCEERVNSR